MDPDENLLSVQAAERNGCLEASRAGAEPLGSIVVTDWTTRIAVCRQGQVIDSAAVALGGLTLSIDADHNVLAISETGETFLDAVAKKVKVGDRLEAHMPELLANLMAETVVNLVARRRPPQITMRLLHTEPLTGFYDMQKFFLGFACLENRMSRLFHQSLKESLEDRELHWQDAS